MRAKTLISLICLFGLQLCLAAGVSAGPWRSILNIRHIEADQSKPYWLTEDNGPWCILAASFAGQGAQEEAHRLVMELRKEFGLEAHMHARRYDYTEPVRGLGVDRYGAPKKMRYLRGGSYDEVAVLVGNFDSVDSPTVEKTLQRIKYAQPECMKLQGRKHTTQRFAGLRAIQRMINANEEKNRKGPMGNAFVTRNPLLPQAFFTPSGVDKFVLQMNKDVPHCLLDCPGKFSVRVASFRGNVILDQSEIQRIERGGHMNTRLDQAAEKAHRLTEALRAKNIEAYEFHDRHESVVTIGSFDSVGTPRADGRIEINPAIHKIMEEFGAEAQKLPGGATAPGLMPRVIAGIPLDVQPVPVEVPQRSIAADYARFR